MACRVNTKDINNYIGDKFQGLFPGTISVYNEESGQLEMTIPDIVQKAEQVELAINETNLEFSSNQFGEVVFFHNNEVIADASEQLAEAMTLQNINDEVEVLDKDQVWEDFYSERTEGVQEVELTKEEVVQIEVEERVREILEDPEMSKVDKIVRAIGLVNEENNSMHSNEQGLDAQAGNKVLSELVESTSDLEVVSHVINSVLFFRAINNDNSILSQVYIQELTDSALTKDMYGKIPLIEAYVMEKYPEMSSDMVQEKINNMYEAVIDEVRHHVRTDPKMDEIFNAPSAFDNIAENNAKFSKEKPIIAHVRKSEGQLKRVEALLKKLNKQRHDPTINKANLKKRITYYNKMKALLEADIVNLRTDEYGIAYAIASAEIITLSEELQGDIIDTEGIRDRVNVLRRLIKGLDEDFNTIPPERFARSYAANQKEGYAELNNAMDALDRLYEKAVDKVFQNVVDSSIQYNANVADNINPATNEPYTVEELKDLFEATKDISWFDTQFMGLGSSAFSKDTLTPQLIQSLINQKETKHATIVNSYALRLSKAIEKLGGYSANFDFVRELDSNGNETGNLINMFNKSFDSFIGDFLKIDRTDADNKTKYASKKKWLDEHVEKVDFRKLSAVKNEYGNMYGEHFTASEEEMLAYEQELKEQLGEFMFNEIQNNILKKLSEYEFQKDLILDDDTNTYRHHSIAKMNPWTTIGHLLGDNADNPFISYLQEDGQQGVAIPNFSYLYFAPKIKKFKDGKMVDTGFYNKAFTEMVKDENKAEYWAVMRDIYKDYIAPTYGDKMAGKMSLAKFENSFKDELKGLSAKELFKKIPYLTKKAVVKFRETFHDDAFDYEEESVKSNYTDGTRKEVNKLANTYFNFLPKEELLHKARTLGIRTQVELRNDDGVLIQTLDVDMKQLSREIARAEIMSKYSRDINQTTSALLSLAGLMRAKQEVLPLARLLEDKDKRVKAVDKKGNKVDRTNQIAKTKSAIDRIIIGDEEDYTEQRYGAFLGYNLSENGIIKTIFEFLGNLPLIGKYVDETMLKTHSESEQHMINILKEAESIIKQGGELNPGAKFYYKEATFEVESPDKIVRIFTNEEGVPTKQIISREAYEEAFVRYVSDRINSLGTSMTVASFIDGVLKMFIFKSLGLNPVSGIFNRIEGKNSAMIMDASGYYWTPGNIDKVNNFLFMGNSLNIVNNFGYKVPGKKSNELEKLRALLRTVSITQDVKNELERQSYQAALNYDNLLDPMQFAVEHPEFKNQSSVILSVLMDTYVEDVDGNAVPLFDGTQFLAWDVDKASGKLVLKDKFRTEKNLANWENFALNEEAPTAENNQFFLTKMKMKKAIASSQGNYDRLDTILGTKYIWGRAMLLFRKWMPEHINQRFGSGQGIDLTTGKQRLEGRYRTAFKYRGSAIPIIAGTMMMTYGGVVVPIAAIAGYLAISQFAKKKGYTSVSSEASSAKILTGTIISTLAQTVAYPAKFFYLGKHVNKFASTEIGSKVMGNYYLQNANISDQEANNLIAMTRELAAKIVFLSALLLFKAVAGEGDDEDEVMRNKFISNQLANIYSSLDMYMKPGAFYEQQQRLAFWNYLTTKVYPVLENISAFAYNSVVGNDTLDNETKIKKHLPGAIPLPNIITNFVAGSVLGWQPNSAPWQATNEFGNVNWIDALAEDKKTDGNASATKTLEAYRKNLKAQVTQQEKDKGYSGEELNDRVNERMKFELPDKQKFEADKDYLARIQAGEKGTGYKAESIKDKMRRSRKERREFQEYLNKEGIDSPEERAARYREHFGYSYDENYEGYTPVYLENPSEE